ncbi:MAG: hypothetical protein Kow0026_19480 [Oricola sp.]
MTVVSPETEGVDFGNIPDTVDAMLQRGVAAYRTDRARAEKLFAEALAAAPRELPVYYCLYKVHTYQGNLGAALATASKGLAEAARQAGWPEDWERWPVPAGTPDGPARFALYTLKALAFIHLKRNDPATARRILDRLCLLDPAGLVGWRVIEALADAVG